MTLQSSSGCTHGCSLEPEDQIPKHQNTTPALKKDYSFGYHTVYKMSMKTVKMPIILKSQLTACAHV